jgi:hypothetical protein
MTDEQEERVRNFLYMLSISSQRTVIQDFHHGDCVGADEQAAKLAAKFGYHIIGHPPIEASGRANFPSAIERDPKPFLARNLDIVRESELILATPKEYDEVRRSGTWATIRYARRFSRKLRIILPSGRVIVEGEEQ